MESYIASIAAIVIAVLVYVFRKIFFRKYFVDKRDKKKYRIVKIGKYIWMAENLAYDAPNIKSCCYDNDKDNCKKYGRLYDRKTAKDACPPGWHLPSHDEWKNLIESAGGDAVAGKKLKAKDGWKDYGETSGNGTDDFGFSALPGGLVNSAGTHRYDRCDGRWWSNSESNDDKPYAYGMVFHDKGDKVRPLSKKEDKDFFCSIRCVQD
ncbi:MAG: hypothetical protein FWF67_01670 [Fibromonadales bacterium]|nr:hypothetical protein [Fibromonadales bacterium]